MRLLVTGSTGFVGRHLVRRLVDQHELHCLVRRPVEGLSRSGCHVIYGDLAQPLDANTLPHQVDTIVHLASVNAPFPERANESFQVITASTQQLLEYGRRAGMQRFIYASSGAVYGFGPNPWREDDLPHPSDLYAVNKYCSELLINLYATHFVTCILRIFFPYGPGQKSRRIPMIVERVREGKPVDLVNGGQPKINPIYVEDLVQVVVDALTLNQHATANVAGDEIIDMKDMACLIGDIVGRTPLFHNTTDPATSDLVADNQRMHELFRLGLLTSLREGLQRTLMSPPLQG